MSLSLWRHLDGKAACISENVTLAEKRGPLSSEKALNSKPTAATEPEVSKKCQTMFFHANTIKKGQKMPNYDVHTKHHIFMPNHHKNTPTWQPWWRFACKRVRDVTCLVGQISMHGLLQEPPVEHLSLSILSFQNFYGGILSIPCAIICKVCDMSAKLCLLPLPRIC